jgi:glycosyltransferase involved in cell wall biosynthesis
MAITPTVTVVMPVYNGERFLAEALDSVLAQSFVDFVAIVVDDASTDGTAAILEKCTDSRVRIMRNAERMGVAGARNRALDWADTPYIAFLDSDDVACPTRLERQVGFLRAHAEIRIVTSSVAVISEDSRPTGAVWGHAGADHAIPAMMLFGNCLATSTVMVDRRLLVGERFDASLNPVDDYDMWLRLLDRTCVACLPEVLVRYRIHPASLMHTSEAVEESLQRIATERLTRLGVVPTAAELAVHRALGAGRLRGTSRDLAAADRWLEKLDEANLVAQMYPGAVFRDVLSSHWLAGCDAAARAGEWNAWPVILRSRLTARLLGSPVRRRPFVSLPWRTARGLVRRRWPRAGPAIRGLVR